MQKLGSGVTYARRYTFTAMLEIEEKDDDANDAANVSDKSSNTKPAATPSGTQTNGEINPNDWELKEGTSAKNGKPWKGYFHKTNKDLKYWASDAMFAKITAAKNK